MEKASWERVKAKDSTLGEKVVALAVSGIMKGKRKLGMGLKRGKKLRLKKRRIIRPPSKIGGFLPMLLPILGTLGALGGGAAGIAKAVNDAKTSKQLLQETQRHNKAMENVSKGSGLFIKPYKTGGKVVKGNGLFIKPYKGGSIKKRCIRRRCIKKKMK